MLCPRYPNWLVVKASYLDNFLPAEFAHPHPEFRVDGIPIPRSKASIMKIAIIADPTTRAKFFFICFQASTARSRPRRREPNVNFEQSCSIQSSSKGCFRKYVGATGSILSPHLLNNIRSGNKRLVSKIRQTYLSITSMKYRPNDPTKYAPLNPTSRSFPENPKKARPSAKPRTKANAETVPHIIHRVHGGPVNR